MCLIDIERVMSISGEDNLKKSVFLVVSYQPVALSSTIVVQWHPTAELVPPTAYLSEPTQWCWMETSRHFD